MKIFTHEAEKLKEVLYQWKYPNYEESDLSQSETEIIVPENEGRVINVLPAV